MADNSFLRWRNGLIRPGRIIAFLALTLLAVQPSLAQFDVEKAGTPVEGLPGRVRVTHIQFDHSGSEALPLRVDYTTPIQKPEWVMDERSGAALFVQNSPVEFLARFEGPENLDSAYIWAETGDPPGDISGSWISFSNGVSDPEYSTFSTETAAPAGLGHHTWTWQWYMDTGNGPVRVLNASGPHEIYTILAEPGLPWSMNPGNTHNPWTDALDLALEEVEAMTVAGVLEDITAYCFDRPCFEYDIWSGAPCYISGWNFNLTLFINDMETGHDPRVGCCYDGAAIVHTLADILGAHTHFVWSNPFGYLNCIDPIGRGEDYANNPFHENYYYRDDPITYQDGSSSSCGRSAFGNHAFAASQPGIFGIIWDATMCVDVDVNRDTSVDFPPDGGYTSTDLTALTLTDTTQNWITDQWAGLYLNPNTNDQTPDPYLEYLIAGNTATTITVEDGSDMTLHADTGDCYWIRNPSAPAVDIVRLSGYHWMTYESMTRDGGSASEPEELSISLH